MADLKNIDSISKADGNPFFGGVGFPFKGALVKLASSLTGINYSTATAVPWTAETYDIGDWHDNSSNNTRLTVPAGVTKVRVGAQAQITSVANDATILFQLNKNGSLAHGAGLVRTSTVHTSPNSQAFSAVQEVVAGDYFEMKLSVSDTSVDLEEAFTFFSIEAIETVAPSVTPRGALVHKAADETGANYSSLAAIPWTAESYDTDTIHDNSTNNSRLTVPAGVTRVRLTGAVNVSVATGDEHAAIFLAKNGGFDFIGGVGVRAEDGTTTAFMQLTSTILEVTGGDYFELHLQIETDTSITVDDDRSWFSMEIVEPVLVARESHRGALVTKAADQTTANYTSYTAIAWDAEGYDTDTIHDNSTNNSRLTVPAGVTRVKISVSLRLTLVDADQWVYFLVEKNGSSDFLGAVGSRVETSQALHLINGNTAVLEVTVGDYFEVKMQIESDTSITLEADKSWFSMEIIE